MNTYLNLEDTSGLGSLPGGLRDLSISGSSSYDYRSSIDEIHNIGTHRGRSYFVRNGKS